MLDIGFACCYLYKMAMMKELKPRAKEILSAIIRDYICTGEPVGSKSIAERYRLGIGSASIRKIMCELEGEGFLTQPHTSAGRIPTLKSFRYYIDSLMKIEALLKVDKETIRTFAESAPGPEERLREATRCLSMLTHTPVMVSAARVRRFLIKSLNAVKVDSTSIMVIAVSCDSVVQNMLVRLPKEDVEKINFERVTNYLNSIASGRTLIELKKKVLREMEDEKNLCDAVVARALKLSALALEGEEYSENSSGSICYVEGRVNIIDQPEFSLDHKKMKRMLTLFEEKGLLVKILESCISEKGPTIRLGSESDIEGLDGVSFVAAPYSANEGLEGALCVVGPIWMNYPRIVPLVGYTAEHLSTGLSERRGLKFV